MVLLFNNAHHLEAVMKLAPDQLKDLKERWQGALKTPVRVMAGDDMLAAADARREVMTYADHLIKDLGCDTAYFWNLDMETGELTKGERR